MEIRQKLRKFNKFRDGESYIINYQTKDHSGLVLVISSDDALICTIFPDYDLVEDQIINCIGKRNIVPMILSQSAQTLPFFKNKGWKPKKARKVLLPVHEILDTGIMEYSRSYEEVLGNNNPAGAYLVEMTPNPKLGNLGQLVPASSTDVMVLKQIHSLGKHPKELSHCIIVQEKQGMLLHGLYFLKTTEDLLGEFNSFPVEEINVFPASISNTFDFLSLKPGRIYKISANDEEKLENILNSQGISLEVSGIPDEIL